MRLSKTCISIVVAALVSPVCAIGAGAQDETQDAAQSDTQNAARADTTKADSVQVERFVPTWKSFMKAGDTSVSLGSSMTVSLNPGGDWRLSHSVSVESKDYRNRDMQQINESLMNTASKLSPGLYAVNLSVGESYMKQQTLGLARFGKDIIVNNQTANLNLKFQKPLLGARSSEIVVATDGRRGTNDFKYDSAISGSASGFFRYGFGDALKLSGGVGTSRRSETSKIGTRKIEGLPSKADTVKAFVHYGGGDKGKEPFKAQYSRSYGIERKIAPPRGNALEILDDPDKALDEEERKVVEQIKMNSYLKPAEWLAVEFEFKRDFSDQKNKVDTRLSTKKVSNEIKGSATYFYTSSGSIRFDVVNYEGEYDYGPLSPSSFKDNKRTFTVSFRQKLGDSVKVYMRGSTSLKQQFFKQRETNPRDADYLYYSGIFRMDAVPFENVTTKVDVHADRYERINIDKSLSGENRIDYLYEVKPSLTVKPAPWLAITQDYRIKIEFTDFVYTEERNFLNRTTTLGTGATFYIRQPLTFGFDYRYLMKDTGSYLYPEDGGERLYNRESEDFENGLYLSLDYMPDKDFSVTAQADFRNQKNNRLGSSGGTKVVSSSTLYESGSLKLGVARKKEIFWGGTLDLDVAYIKRFGPFLSKEKKEYWDVETSLKFVF